MEIVFGCHCCGGENRVPRRLSGYAVRCVNCKEPLTVPDPDRGRPLPAAGTASSDPGEAAALASAGDALLARGHPVAAESFLRQAVELLDGDPTASSTALPDALGLLGKSLRMQDRHAEAEPLLRRAISLYEWALEGDDPRIVELILDLARTCADMGAPIEASRLRTRAATFGRRRGGP